MVLQFCDKLVLLNTFHGGILSEKMDMLSIGSHKNLGTQLKKKEQINITTHFTYLYRIKTTVVYFCSNLVNR